MSSSSGIPKMQTTNPEIRDYRLSPQAPNPYLFLVALECLHISADNMSITFDDF